jgi:hypothetical protein
MNPLRTEERRQENGVSLNIVVATVSVNQLSTRKCTLYQREI